jgi:Ribbon-helix-helix protein, copG family
MTKMSDFNEKEDQRGAAVSVRMPPELVVKIERAAARELISTSAFIRRAALRAVADQEGAAR